VYNQIKKPDMNYSRVQYENYKSEKLKSYQEIEKEKNKALDLGVDEITIVNLSRQLNGLYSGIKVKYFYKNNTWKQIKN
jgi:hypothetical protein